MKFFIICCLLLFSAPVCRAQLDSTFSKTDKDVLSKIQELRNKKIDTIVCYYIDCIGALPRLEIPDSCTSSKTKYLLWRSNSKSFIQKFDECNVYKAISINSAFFSLLKHNYKQFKYPEFYEIVNGKKILSNIWQDHSCHTMFEIDIKGIILIKDIDAFALDTKYVDDKYLNINYMQNQQSLLKKLKKIAEADVIAYNKALIR
jgi:hypothetical protein